MWSWNKVATMAIRLIVVALCTNCGSGSSYFNIRISSCIGMDCEVKRGCGNISEHVTSPSTLLISA